MTRLWPLQFFKILSPSTVMVWTRGCGDGDLNKEEFEEKKKDLGY